MGASPGSNATLFDNDQQVATAVVAAQMQFPLVTIADGVHTIRVDAQDVKWKHGLGAVGEHQCGQQSAGNFILLTNR